MLRKRKLKSTHTGTFTRQNIVRSSIVSSCFLEEVLQFQGNWQTHGCEQNINDNLEKSYSSIFCLTILSQVFQKWDSIFFIFQFLQKGTFLWLIHYQKYPISSKILSHKILEHNKRYLRVPRCSDNSIIVTLILWTSSLLYCQQTSIVWQNLLIILFGPQFLQLQNQNLN